jgi:hypothetical protein
MRFFSFLFGRVYVEMRERWTNEKCNFQQYFSYIVGKDYNSTRKNVICFLCFAETYNKHLLIDEAVVVVIVYSRFNIFWLVRILYIHRHFVIFQWCVLSCRLKHERDSNSQRKWWYALDAHVLVNQTTLIQQGNKLFAFSVLLKHIANIY